MLLNFPHKQIRRQSQDERLIETKNQSTDLKNRIIKNIAENVRNQCDVSTDYYCWSGLDPALKISTEAREQRLIDLITIYCNDKVHTVLNVL